MVELCDDGSALTIIRAIMLVVAFIQVAVPLIIIVISAIDLFKAISGGNPKSLRERLTVIGKRIIAALIIVFVPTIIHLTLKVISTDDNNYFECIENANEEGIQTAYYHAAERAIDELEESEDENLKGRAQGYIDKITDPAKKEELQTRYNNVLAEVKEKNKPKITQHIPVTPSNPGGSGGSGGSGPGNNPVHLGDPLNVQGGDGLKSFNASTGRTINYYEIVPKNAKENMPLIVYLHGDGEVYNMAGIPNLPIYRFIKDTYDNEIPFVFVAPHTNVTDWISSPIPETVKSLIDSKISEYKIDTKHVIIMGASRGAIGTWNMVAKYGTFFSAACPISCPAVTSSDPNSYKNVAIYAISGDSGSQEAGYNSSMTDLVNRISAAGGTAIKKTYNGETHNTIAARFPNKELLIWLLTH